VSDTHHKRVCHANARSKTYVSIGVYHRKMATSTSDTTSAETVTHLGQSASTNEPQHSPQKFYDGKVVEVHHEFAITSSGDTTTQIREEHCGGVMFIDMSAGTGNLTLNTPDAPQCYGMTLEFLVNAVNATPGDLIFDPLDDNIVPSLNGQTNLTAAASGTVTLGQVGLATTGTLICDGSTWFLDTTYSGSFVTAVATAGTPTLTAKDAGQTFTVDSTSEPTITLPPAADCPGATFEFINITGTDGIVWGDNTADEFHLSSLCTSVTHLAQDVTGDVLTLGTSVVGDWFKFTSLGSANIWFVYAVTGNGTAPAAA